MKYFFTSDYHLGHFNIIKYCHRPFKTLKQMNDAIIKRHNSRVKPGDIVFHIGDFCFKNSGGGKKGEGQQVKAREWEKKLNGKIIYIKGNHDRNNSCKTLIDNVIISIGKYKINLVHDPKNIDNRYHLQFVGHKHDKWKFRRINRNMYKNDKRIIKLINVGVDVWDFYPRTFDELINGYKKWEKKQK